jgi:hypothetical protein
MIELRTALSVLAASALLASLALAQTPTAPPPSAVAVPSRCPDVGPEPALPDGAHATDRQMAAAGEAYRAWATGVQTNVECRRTEHAEIAAQRRTVAQSHDTLNARLREVSQRWARERNAFCAQPRRQCRAIGPDEMSVPQGPQDRPCAASVSAPEPTIPDAATATQAAMNLADAAYLAWGREVQTILQCRSAEFTRITALLQSRQADHDRLAQRLNAVTTAWEAELAEFCGRPRKRCDNPGG